ncbi:ET module [Oesophagostomum dentatum]|uniref:ET module n=1 Tax=Oesophagostomum dentatum TaxID=61180 RepID=A0A0B1TF30_OESDE|nr:ET module [Oesophagostomum dentatum]
MINNCVTIESGVQGCCCNTDGCLTPKKKPGNVLFCYVGLYAKNAGINVGAEVPCDGQCSSVSGIVNGDNVATFQCVPLSICKSLALNNGCGSLPGDREVQGCCCDSGNSCNLYQLNRTDIPIPTPAPVREFPISCWTGIYVNGNAITTAGFQSCFGECASVTLQTTVNSTQHNATIYMCDPTSVCQALNMSNACATVEPGLSGCCCNDDGCLTPQKSPANNPLMCYVGVNAPLAGVNVGAVVPCVGMCSSLNGMVNGDNVTTFQCAPTSVCKSLSAYNGCNTLQGDREITGCCCDSQGSCNLANRPDIPLPTPSPVSEYPISCWSGLYVNGNPISSTGFTTCFGDCASITINTTVGTVAHTASMYMCDPTSVCRALNMSNQCANVEPGLGGCCCNTDNCLNPLTNTFPGNDLICYVGIYHEPGYYVGSEMKCSGKCASLQTTIGGTMLKSYHCAPTSVCKALTVDNSCGPVYKDSDVTACCCDNANNCNVKEPISTNTTAPAFTGTPIACQSGIYVDGAPLTTDNTFIACKGQCAKLSYPTNVTGTAHTLDIYTCDPVSVCSALGSSRPSSRSRGSATGVVSGMANGCISSINGTAVSGCCCGYDGCVTPSVTPTTGSGASLSLLVAIFAAEFILGNSAFEAMQEGSSTKWLPLIHYSNTYNY